MRGVVRCRLNAGRSILSSVMFKYERILTQSVRSGTVQPWLHILETMRVGGVPTQQLLRRVERFYTNTVWNPGAIECEQIDCTQVIYGKRPQNYDVSITITRTNYTITLSPSPYIIRKIFLRY